MAQIMVQVREVPGAEEPRLRKPGAARRYWTRAPEPADDADPQVVRYLAAGQLVRVDVQRTKSGKEKRS